MLQTKLLFLSVLLLGCAAISRAQDTAFWFVAPHMSTMSYNPPLNYPAFLAISNGTFQGAKIAITLYNGGSTKV
ncbi:MAG: hypothetical protein LBS05_08300, partial [Tannerellaceae bacterium]|nr:hypothetical protein [Tannerellaceae bacterium]